MPSMTERETQQGPAAIAFGLFDGLHLGHRAVLAALAAWKDRGMTTKMVSWDCQPMGLFNDGHVIYTENEKKRLTAELGLDQVLTRPLGRALAKLEPEELLRQVLLEEPGTKVIVAGENVRFGREGRGDADLLRALAEPLGYRAEIVPAVELGGEPVTTARVRRAFEKGNFSQAQTLLGHTYIMEGTVVHGKGHGQRSGMPTANLGVPVHKLLPPFGVYATLSLIDGKRYKGLTNIGLRPSDDDLPYPTVETFLLDFDRDIYYRQVVLEVHAYVRGIRKFHNLDEVRRQVDRDILATREFLDRLVPEEEAKGDEK